MGNILAEIKNDNQEAADWLLYYPYRRQQFYQDRINLLNAAQEMPEVKSTVALEILPCKKR